MSRSSASRERRVRLKGRQLADLDHRTDDHAPQRKIDLQRFSHCQSSRVLLSALWNEGDPLLIESAVTLGAFTSNVRPGRNFRKSVSLRFRGAECSKKASDPRDGPGVKMPRPLLLPPAIPTILPA